MLPQCGHFVFIGKSGKEVKLLASVSMPVETARLVLGHVIITTPM
jgi:hypothetical protein